MVSLMTAKLEGVSVDLGAKKGGMVFDFLCGVVSLETVPDRVRSQLITYRNTCFRFKQKSITLNDLERQLALPSWLCAYCDQMAEARITQFSV